MVYRSIAIHRDCFGDSCNSLSSARWLTKSKVNNIVHGKSLTDIGHI